MVVASFGQTSMRGGGALRGSASARDAHSFVLTEGDSITKPQALSSTQSYPGQAAGALSGAALLVNNAVAGNQSSQILTRVTGTDTAILDAWTRQTKVFTIMGGINDLRGGV